MTRGSVGAWCVRPSEIGSFDGHRRSPRAPGRFEGTTVREQLLDRAAAELGMDRVVLRQRNLLRPEELPHERQLNTLGTDMVLDSGVPNGG